MGIPSTCGRFLWAAAWRRVADDESRHLSWCLQRLEELGFEYGCMPAHDLLWEGCQLSQHDLGARLAVVPMGQVRAGGRQAACASCDTNTIGGRLRSSHCAGSATPLQVAIQGCEGLTRLPAPANVVQEARGLDAGDRLAKRLVGMGDNRTAAIVRRVRQR